MTDVGTGGWRPPRERPPWWPENEAWPPERGWRGPPRRFFWRFVGFALVFLVLVNVVIGVVFTAFTQMAGPHWPGEDPGGPPGFFFPWPVLLLVLFAAVVGSIASGRALRRVADPLAEVMAATSRVAGGDHSARVQPRGPKPVAEMATAFNTMAERLEGADRQRRELLADVTHELRTPLTVMQAELEALLDNVHERDDARIAALLDEIRVMSRLVDDLRTLSIADAGALELHREPTGLFVLLNDVVDSFRDRARAAQVTLVVEPGAAPVMVDIDPVRIRQVLSNLLDNALRHTPVGGSITVRADRAGGEVTVEVTDTGSGIGPDVLPRLFERFAKGPRSRGSGLGLAIARGLIRAHGGRIEADSPGPGRGTTIRFTLPTTAA
jgi:two-component system sensor histidine kinase BaeS